MESERPGEEARSSYVEVTESGARRGPIRLLSPEYGLVEGVVGFGVFYLVVDQLTPTILAEMAGPLPNLAPEPVGTGLAALLWLVLGVTLLGIVTTQLAANPREFPDRKARNRFLDDHRPTEDDYRLNLVLMVLGGATAVLAWETAIAVLGSMLPLVLTPGGPLPAALTVGNAAILVAFVLGFAAYARGLDRLVIGGMREFRYRSYSGDWE